MGVIKEIADKHEPLQLAKQVEEDVMLKGLELNAAIRNRKEELKKLERVESRFND